MANEFLTVEHDYTCTYYESFIERAKKSNAKHPKKGRRKKQDFVINGMWNRCFSGREEYVL